MMISCPGINNYTDTESPWSTDRRNYAIGAVATLDFWWTDANSILHKAKIVLAHFRALAAIAGAGIPVLRSYNSTYGVGVTGTYAAADVTNVVGITIAATSYAAGDGIWVQVGGPNYVGVANTGAIAAGARVEHNGSGTTVKTVATDANTFAQNTIAAAGNGTLPVGSLIINNRFGYVNG